MKQRILYLFTRTPLHVGAGSSVGAIDQPVIRERHTGFPIIPGSGVKGVLRDYLAPQLTNKIADLFGEGSDGAFTAGKVSFSEAKLLAFPVRSAKGAFALATSPLTLQRFARDAEIDLAVPGSVEDSHCLAGNKVTIERGNKKGAVLEEYRFDVDGTFPTEWEEVLTKAISDAVLAGSVGRFVLLSDGDLSHFALNACQVNQHVRIDDEKGTAEEGGLFNEETVPSEALFYSVLTPLSRLNGDTSLFDCLQQECLVQFGGNGTTGLGFCTVKLGN